MERTRTQWWLSDTISRRLAVVLAVPTAAMLFLLGVGLAGRYHDYTGSTRAAAAIRLELSVQGLVHQLQRERGLTNGLLGHNAALRDQILAQRTLVTGARAELDAELTGQVGDTAERTRQALTPLDELPAVRTQVDALQAEQAGTFQFFTDRIQALNRLDLSPDGADRVLQNGTAALLALGEAKEFAARERGFLNGVFSVGTFRDQEYLEFIRLRAAKQTWLDSFARYATPGQRASMERATTSAAAGTALVMEQQALAAPDGRRLSVPASVWWTAATTVIDGLRGTQLVIGTDLTAAASDTQQQARLQAIGLAAAALAGLAVAVLLVATASRSITRPLTQLLAEARDVAQLRLPLVVGRLQDGEESVDPPAPVAVPALAGAEIRAVAAAFDQVQDAAYRLATEQAVLRRNTTESLANLGRRHQNLLRRQLGLISRLESQESEPAALANLFELDHLATRMRRNAESLLVLVGRHSLRGRSRPMPIGDVIRAATSEVEEYQRIGLRRLDDGTMLGSVVPGVAHLLAELLENGLSCSPPDSEVEIHGRWVDGGYLIAIVDHGIGMSATDLELANARLRGTDRFLAAPTRYLGHYVVAALARRLGADVALAPSPVTGVTARVFLPAGSVVTDAGHAAAEPLALLSPTPAPLMAVPPMAVAGAVPDTENIWFELPPTDLPTDDWDAARSAPSGGGTVLSMTAPGLTRSGLVKRVPRTGSGSSAPATEPSATTRATADRGPKQVASMLGAFRNGVRRGGQTTAGSDEEP